MRDELLELTRRFATHVAWQRELGARDFPTEGPWPEGAFTHPPTPPEVSVEVSLLATSPPGPLSLAGEGEPEENNLLESQKNLHSVSPSPDRERGPGGEVAEGALDEAGRRVALAVIAEEIAGCHKCGLAARRTKTVPCRGNPMARLAFVGEGPGRDEDLQGLPFVGAAGQLLDKIIAAMGLYRERDVWIGNIVKCRPPNNRTPEAAEMSACTPFLVRQLGVTRPEVIVALGKTAAGFLLGSRESMGRLRGRWGAFQGVPVLPTWHPSYLLRQEESGDRSARKETWEDMQLVLKRLGLSVPTRAR